MIPHRRQYNLHRLASWKVGAAALLAAVLVIAAFLVTADGDALYFVRIGTRFSVGDPAGTEGYDGQFIYYLARDPDPGRVAAFLDIPAYRYQRILMPFLARALALGRMAWLPWILLLIGGLSIGFGTCAVALLLASWGVNPWYALVAGLWPGFLMALVADLPEPLAFALIAWGFVALARGKNLIAWLLLGLAVFAKEVSLLFVLATAAAYLLHKNYRLAAGISLVAVLPFLLFQVWLIQQFGSPGIGSGGAMATPFEWFPFMGFWRIAIASWGVFLAYLAVFGPGILLPTLWGLWAALRAGFQGERNVIVLALAINCLSLVFLPFSTFREPGGLLRFAGNLVLMVILFAGYYRRKRVLNYTLLWLVLNVFLLKG